MKAWAVLALLGAAAYAGELDEYLGRHLMKLESGGRFDAGLLDTSGKRLFLLGETHAVAGNEQLDLSLLRYLHRTAGVRFYVYEGGYSTGEMLNRYFASGDEKLLDFLMDQMQGSPAWNRENREFWKAFGDWNRALPPADRVRVVGIDIEHQSEIAWRCLAELGAQAGPPPEAVREVVERLAAGARRAGIDADLAASLAAHPADYAGWLGPRLADFELVTGNLRKRDDYYKQPSSLDRDRAMLETFRTIDARYPGAHWFGRLGTAHIPQRRVDRDSFAMLLAREPAWRGKIVSIRSLYKDSARLDVQGYRSVAIHDDDARSAPFVAAAGGSKLTLFRLDAEGSPLLPGSAGFLPPEAGVSADSVQYVVLVQGAPAAHPLHDFPPTPAGTLADAPPVVVRTSPEAGAADVPPGLAEIRIVFSKEMRPAGWSFVTDPPLAYPATGTPHYVDSRTVVLPVKLAPATAYGMWLNTEKFQSFMDALGHPAVPYLLVFRTRE